MKKSQSKLKSQRVKKKNTKIKLPINEHEVSFHVTTIHDFKLYSLSLQIENKK